MNILTRVSWVTEVRVPLFESRLIIKTCRSLPDPITDAAPRSPPISLKIQTQTDTTSDHYSTPCIVWLHTYRAHLYAPLSAEMAEEAKAHSVAHQKWILELLKEKGGKALYEDVVVKGEEMHCAPPKTCAPISLNQRKNWSSHTRILVFFRRHCRCNVEGPQEQKGHWVRPDVPDVPNAQSA